MRAALRAGRASVRDRMMSLGRNLVLLDRFDSPERTRRPRNHGSWSIAAVTVRRTRWPPESSTGRSACAAGPAVRRAAAWRFGFHQDGRNSAARMMPGTSGSASASAPGSISSPCPRGCQTRGRTAWSGRERPIRGTGASGSGADRPEAGFETIQRRSEIVAEFDDRPRSG